MDYTLSKGAHGSFADGYCAMELAAWLAGKPHSDQPSCVSPVLRRFCITLNDRLGDDDRQRLLPYLPRTLGTTGDGRDDERVRMCREWLVKVALPAHLDRAGRKAAARQLRALPDALTVEATAKAIRLVRDEAWSARVEARDRLKDRILAEMKKRDVAAVAADAVAAVAAAAGAGAVADAVAVAVAVADAAAAVAVVAVADAAAAVAAGRSSVWKAVYKAVKPKMIERAEEINAEILPSTLNLLDRMLPTQVIQVPVVDGWREICQVAA